MEKKNIAVVFGTRPEAIKMAPVIRALKKQSDYFKTTVIVSAQHREMLDQVLDVFDIKPDFDLNIMKRNQSLSEITSRVLSGIEEIFIKNQPDLVLVHGDTTTSFAAAMAAYYQKIPIGHVEAGLRTNDKYFPFPEEVNRQLIDIVTDLYFVPTAQTRSNLLSEGKRADNIFITGNTVIDAVLLTKELNVNNSVLDLMRKQSKQKWIVLTMHRRENHGEPMRNVFQAIRKVIEENENVSVLMPVHMSPTVQSYAKEFLSNHERIHLVEPMEVNIFHKIMNESYLILTDSGGLQEEAPALNVPVLVLRDKTERPEGLEAGTLRVIGTEKSRVVSEVNNLLTNELDYKNMSDAHNPYGDGTASEQITERIRAFFEKP